MATPLQETFGHLSPCPVFLPSLSLPKLLTTKAPLQPYRQYKRRDFSLSIAHQLDLSPVFRWAGNIGGPHNFVLCGKLYFSKPDGDFTVNLEEHFSQLKEPATSQKSKPEEETGLVRIPAFCQRDFHLLAGDTPSEALPVFADLFSIFPLPERPTDRYPCEGDKVRACLRGAHPCSLMGGPSPCQPTVGRPLLPGET